LIIGQIIFLTIREMTLVQSNFDALPVELLEGIFNHLDFTDLLKLRVSSKLFRSTLANWNFWSHRTYDQINFSPAQFIMTQLEWPHHRYYQLAKFYRQPHESLMIAARHGDMMTIDDILQLKRHTTHWCDVLGEAVKYGQMDVMKRLLHLDYDYYCDLAFERAASYGHINIVQYLADLSGPGNTLRLNFDNALKWAAGAGYRHIIDFLYQRAGNNLNLNLNRAASHAAYQGQLGMVQYLITLSDGTINLNDVLVGATHGNQIKVAEYLIQSGATNLNGALFEASMSGQLEMVKFFLEQDTYAIGLLNESLGEAARYGHLDIVKALIQAGANDLTEATNQARRSWTHRGRHDVCEYLESLIAAQ
jgi:hypothetical protein